MDIIGRKLQAWTGGTGCGLEAQTLGMRHEHHVLAQMEGELHAAIVVETRIRAWTGASSGANPEWMRAGAGVDTRGYRRGTCGYRGVVYK